MSRYVERPRMLHEPDEAKSVRQIATRTIEVVVFFVFAISHMLNLAEHSVNVNEGVCYARNRMLDDLRPLDIVGDIHGAFDRLRRLMDTLGYEDRHGRWMHPEGRRVLFLGDYIDRGPNSFAVYRMVRKMVDDGIAIALMGNHELNAIAFSTRENDGVIDARQAHHDACAALATGRPSRGWQRRHELEATKDGRPTLINLQHHRATLVSTDAAEYAQMVEWFIRLPLWLELPDVRAVHAAWIPSAIATLRSWASETTRRNPGLDATQIPGQRPGPTTVDAALEECQRRSAIAAGDSQQRAMLLFLDAHGPKSSTNCARAVELLLKGPELNLPNPLPDPEGTQRDRFRIRWFEPFRGQSIRDYWMGPAHSIRTEVGDSQDERRRAILEATPSARAVENASADVLAGYDKRERPVFFGHYGLRAVEIPTIGSNWACLDYSAFNESGALVSYRLDRGHRSPDGDYTVHRGESCDTPSPARSLRAEQVLAESCLEREHDEHGKEVGASSEPPSGTRPPSRAQYALTLLNCDSDALIARGRELATELAKVDRETSAVLGIPRVWPDQLPTTFGPPDVAPLHGVAPAFVGSVLNDLDMGVDFGVESPVPLDPKISDRIRAMEIPRRANADALNAAIRAREPLGLPIPILRRDTDG